MVIMITSWPCDLSALRFRSRSCQLSCKSAFVGDPDLDIPLDLPHLKDVIPHEDLKKLKNKELKFQEIVNGGFIICSRDVTVIIHHKDMNFVSTFYLTDKVLDILVSLQLDAIVCCCCLSSLTACSFLRTLPHGEAALKESEDNEDAVRASDASRIHHQQRRQPPFPQSRRADQGPRSVLKSLQSGIRMDGYEFFKPSYVLT